MVYDKMSILDLAIIYRDRVLDIRELQSCFCTTPAVFEHGAQSFRHRKSPNRLKTLLWLVIGSSDIALAIAKYFRFQVEVPVFKY
jgi:hypothetical protein